MSDDQLSKIYLIVYLCLFFAVQTALVYFGTELQSPRGIINTALTYLAFVPLFGYACDKQIPLPWLWRVFIILFFLWQAASFFFLYGHSLRIRLVQVLMLAPLYWSLAGYALVTVQRDAGKKAAMNEKKNAFKERFKSFVVIIGALALLLLMLCLFVMLKNYWQTRHMI